MQRLSSRLHEILDLEDPEICRYGLQSQAYMTHDIVPKRLIFGKLPRYVANLCFSVHPMKNPLDRIPMFVGTARPVAGRKLENC